MTRLTPAREAEIREALAGIDPRDLDSSDEAVSSLLAELDAVRAERDDAIRERVSANDRFCPQHRGEWRSNGCVACSVIAGGETERRLRVDLAAAQARLATQQSLVEPFRARSFDLPLEPFPRFNRPTAFDFAPEIFISSPVAHAMHHMWKRDRKVEVLETRLAQAIQERDLALEGLDAPCPDCDALKQAEATLAAIRAWAERQVASVATDKVETGYLDGSSLTAKVCAEDVLALLDAPPDAEETR